ncbi:MAG: S46 family peptidase [Candidatus Zixiibacteriota bacterium]
MWPLYDIGHLPYDSLTGAGLQLSAKDIYNPDGVALADAIVRLRGGTASFVSPTGLLITNHHVAFGAIQKQSTVGQNFIENGFYAETPEQEIPAIGYYAMVTLDVTDVTDRFADILKKSTPGESRHKAIEQRIKEIIAEAERDRDVECKVARMYGDTQFILYTYFRIKDIRIVYAPPEAIGDYGGEIDNWMWPRHVGDFAFVRAYIAPDGSSAEYSTENIPYKPRKYLAMSSRGIKEGDISLLIGYPGSTHRYASTYELEHLLNDYYPLYLKTSKLRMDLLDELADQDAEKKIRLSSTRSGISNYYKKTKGIVRGFKRANLLKMRAEDEKKLRAYLQRNDTEGTPLLDNYKDLISGRKKTYLKDFYLKTLPQACQTLSLAIDLYKWAVEREKADIDREIGYQDRDVDIALEDFKSAQINLVPEYDNVIMTHLLDDILTLPVDQRITGIDEIFAGKDQHNFIHQYVDYLFARSMVGDLDSRLKLFEMNKDELERLNDPMINLAVALYPEIEESKERTKVYDDALGRLDAQAAKAYMALSKKKLHPDANGTKRLNWGIVSGYNPGDAITYHYQTHLSGVFEKETGASPFIIPEALTEAYKNHVSSKYRNKQNNDIPVNFISSNSGTNGNSGSPVLNGRGEFIGIDFDTCIDGVAADYYHNPDVARSIIVDSRYILYIIDEVYGLQGLLSELTIR